MKHPHLFRKFMDLPLAKKLLSSYLLIVLIPTLGLCAFFLFSVMGELNRQYESEKNLMLEQAAQSVGDNLQQIEYCNSTLQYNTAVLDYVENRDLSNGDGVYAYLTGVKSVFNLLRTSNTYIKELCIYRRLPMPHNDPVNVRNQSDSLYLPSLTEEPGVTNLTMAVNLAASGGKCVFFKKLYSDKYYREIGVIELSCAADYLFDSLRFISEEDFLLLQVGGVSYRLLWNENGNLTLLPFSAVSELWHNRADYEIPEIGATLSYYYPDIHINFTGSLYWGLLLVIAILALFTLVYYLVYLSIAKRITGLTDHIAAMSPQNPRPYPKARYSDEVGNLMHRFNDMVRQIDTLINEGYRKEMLVNQAQYYAMESQITPHFLYNTLESINMLIELGEYDRASAMMSTFGKLLRYNVSRKQEIATIEDETGHIRDYLTLYTYRMGDRFCYTMEVEEGCLRQSCPYCMLQPLVENCFKHGFKDIDGEIRIDIRVYKEGDSIVTDIVDNGAGVSTQEVVRMNAQLQAGNDVDHSASQVGLGNVAGRIHLLFGKKSGLRLIPCTSGCHVRIRICEKNRVLLKGKEQ